MGRVEQADDLGTKKGPARPGMRERIESFDWARHPFGPRRHWHPALATTLGICLNSSFPTAIYWGPELRLLYNDAWSVIPAERHPWALGRPAREVWQDIWHIVGPQFHSVVTNAEGFSAYDQLLPMLRDGEVRETYWNYSITPIQDEKGRVLGIFNQGNETTSVIHAARERAHESKRLRETFAQAPGAIAVLRGPDHRFEVANKAYIELIGGRDDLIGRTVSEALPEVVEQGFIDLLDGVYARGEPYIGNGVAVSLLRQGRRETRILDFVYQPTTDAAGKVDGVFVQATDVTARALAERALQGSVARRAFLDELQQATQSCLEAEDILARTAELAGRHLNASLCAYADMDHDQDGFTIRGDWAAPGIESIVGHYRLRDFGELAISRLQAGEPLVINDNRRELPPHAAAAFQSIGISATVCMPLVKEGRLKALMALHHAQPHVWSDDEIALIRDVTDRSWAHVERVSAERDAADSEQRYFALFNSIDEGFCIIEFVDGPRGAFDDYVHIEANPAFALNTGIPDVVGHRVRELVPTEAEGWIDLYRPVLTSGSPIRFQKQLEATGRWLELAAFRVEPPSRHLVAVLFKDVTARREAEDALRNTAIENARLINALQLLNTTLEQRVSEEVAERTRAEEQLRQSQKMEAIGHLTGGIAHDFNNMLAVVIGGLNLLQRRLARGETNVGGYIEAALDGARRAASLTQRLLAFSRQQPLEPVSLAANKLVTAMTELLTRTLGEHIQVETVLTSGLWRCHVDQLQLESAILNLAVNARDAMPGGGKLTIETGNALVDANLARNFGIPEGQYVMLAISDTGSGMTADVMAKAFDPFFTTKAVGKGSGLGLSQVFGFVRQSGGHIKLSSELGVGTTLKLYFPRHIDTDDDERVQAQPPAAPLVTGRELVLVVEDEERVRKYSIEALGELGYRVLAADTPTSALRLIETHPDIDLLFTDIVMPEMNGRQLMERARELLPSLKVLYTTGYARNAVIHNGVLRHGMIFLQKPFTLDQLATKVRQVLDGT